MKLSEQSRDRVRRQPGALYSPLRHAALLLALVWSQPAAAAEFSGATAPAAPSAAQKETARAWLREGDRFFEQKDYRRALERYTAAYRLVRVPTVGVQVATAQAALGEWVEANATAMEVVNLPRQPAEPEVFAQARTRANDLQNSLSARIPSLSVEVEPSTAAVQLEIDGAAMPGNVPKMSYKLNPGKHRLRVLAPGYLAGEREFQLVEQKHEELVVVLEPDPALPNAGLPTASTEAPPLSAASDAPAVEPMDSGSGARTRGVVALGVAGTATLVGSLTGILAFSSKPDCPGNACAPEQKDAIDSSKRYGNIATVSFGVGVVAAAYGLWELWANSPAATASSAREREQSAFALLPSADGATLQVSGSF